MKGAYIDRFVNGSDSLHTDISYSYGLSGTNCNRYIQTCLALGLLRPLTHVLADISTLTQLKNNFTDKVDIMIEVLIKYFLQLRVTL